MRTMSEKVIYGFCAILFMLTVLVLYAPTAVDHATSAELPQTEIHNALCHFLDGPKPHLPNRCSIIKVTIIELGRSGIRALPT